MIDLIQDLEARLALAADLRGRIDAMANLAWELGYFDPSRGLILSEAAQQLAQQDPSYSSGIAASLRAQGLCHDRLGNYQRALALSGRSLELYQSLDLGAEQAAVLYSIGVTHWNLGNFADALDYELRALRSAHQHQDALNVARALNVIGLLYLCVDEPQDSIPYFVESATIFRVIDYHKGLSSALSNCCETYYLLGEPTQGLACGLESLRIHRELGLFRDEGLVHRAIGLNYLALQEPHEAFSHLHQALDQSRALDNLTGEKFSLLSLGEAYLKQNQIEQAEIYLQELLELAQRLDAKSELSHCYELLARIQESKGNYQQALTYYKQFQDLKKQVHQHQLDQKLKMHTITQTLANTEIALQQSQSTNQALFEAIPDMVLKVNREGRYLDCKPSKDFPSLLPAQAYIGKTIFEIYPSPEAEQLMAEVQRALDTGQVQYREYEYLGSKPETKEYRESRHVPCGKDEVLILIRDITQRKRAEYELQDSQSSLRDQLKQSLLLKQISQEIRQSLDPQEIFRSAAFQIGRAFEVNRCVIHIYVSDPQPTLPLMAEYLEPDYPSMLALSPDLLEIPHAQEMIAHDRAIATPDVEADPLLFPAKNLCRRLGLRSMLAVRTSYRGQPNGAIGLHQLDRHRHWTQAEIDLVEAVAVQLGIAFAQAKLFNQEQSQRQLLDLANQKLQGLNLSLEQEVMKRTAEIERTLQFEALLKRITDKVRDTLDEGQILQTVVRELVEGLGILSTDTGIYDLGNNTSTISYEYNHPSIPSALGTVFAMADYPEIYDHLLARQSLQLCWISPFKHQRQMEGRYAVLAQPLTDDQGVIGDLWLYRQRSEGFSDSEIRLVQQVANQCAIAIRQARLYQTAQAQITELQHLNQIKDEFISMVSHELRTPLTGMRLAIEMLTLSQKRDPLSPRQQHYLHLLAEDCRREIDLVNDLLDFAKLESGHLTLQYESIELRPWLSELISRFQERAQLQQQQLLCQIDTPSQQIRSDRFCLERILAELLNNACKYTPPGGRIQVRVSSSSEDSLLMSVGNTAEIPANELPHLFERFYRVRQPDRPNPGGTGLGLALSKQLAHLLGASLQVTSQQGWTYFDLSLRQETNMLIT